MAAPAAPVPAPDTLAQRLIACTVCHGPAGRASREGYFPRIAGKPAGYLLRQLRNFRDGRRGNATMAALLEHLPDEYLQEIARYFADLQLPYPGEPPAADGPGVMARGAALGGRGDPARGLPPCAACHGERLMGVAPAVPALLGLPRDYITSQFGSWQTGRRHADAPDCMADIAQRLNAADIGAIASWLAAQPMPADTLPAAPAAASAPLACGSMAR